jgi:hypothetical protein
MKGFNNTHICDIGVLYNQQNLLIFLVSKHTAVYEITCRNGVRQLQYVKSKVKISLLQAMEAHRVARG